MTIPFTAELTAFVTSLAGEDRLSLSSPLRWVLLANGDTDPCDNVILYGFEPDRSEPSLVVKVPRMPENGWVLQTEYERLTELWDRLGAEAAFYLPRPVAFTTLQRQPLLVLSYLPGENLLRTSKESFWGDETSVLTLAVDAARTLRDLNERTATPIPLSQRRALVDFPRKADKFRETFSLTEKERRALSEVVRVSRDAAAAASHKVLIQGDFWHGNMIRGAEHGRLMFVDWQFARWSIDVSVDVYLFLLAAALKAAPYGPVEERARGAARVLSRWRSEVIPAYLAAYGKPERFVLLSPRDGMLACCVEKAARPIMDFGYHHPDDLMWRHLFAELLGWPEDDGFDDAT